MTLFLANLTRITVCLCAVAVTVGYALGKINSEDFKVALGLLLAAHAGASGVLDGGKSQ